MLAITLIALAQRVRVAGFRFDGERRKSKPRFFAQGIKHIRRTRRAAPRLRHVERIAVAVIAPAPRFKIRRIEIGRVEIQTRSRSLPHVNNTRLRASAWIFARRRGVACEPGVHIHGYVVFGLAGLRDRLNKARVVPGHEDLVRALAVAKNLRPCARGLVAILVPQLFQIGIKRVAMRLQILRQLRRNSPGKGLVRCVGVIARVAQHADFVLHLHHQHGVVARVHSL